jgi:hypothetical protein
VTEQPRRTRSARDDDSNRRPLVLAWLALVVFGRLYTVLLCDIPGRVFGLEDLCYTWLHDIPTYLWFEILVYGPLGWFALHQIKTDVFRSPAESGPVDSAHRRRELAATAAIAMWLYGVGIHAADLVEVLSREREGITEGAVYDLVYFLDEGLSHYVQFLSLFFALGLFVMFDRPGRTEGRALALFLGVSHGIERALGIIEGEKWFLGPAVLVWMSVAGWTRWRRCGRAAFGEFFFRYAVAFLVALPATQALYYARFGDFTPPSELADGPYAQLAAGAVALAVLATAALHGLDHRRRRGL